MAINWVRTASIAIHCHPDIEKQYLMTNYRRAFVKGGSYFFTVNCAERKGSRLLVDHIDLLRNALRKVKQAHPFVIDAIVIHPDHLHCIWTLPPGDMNCQTRWALIKAGFSRLIPLDERRSESREKRGERGIWQRRYWEHLVRASWILTGKLITSIGIRSTWLGGTRQGLAVFQFPCFCTQRCLCARLGV